VDKREEIERETATLLYEVRGMTWQLQARAVLRLLSKYGVVMKVEGELPNCGHLTLTASRYTIDAQCPLLKAGYTLVKPLVELLTKEETDGNNEVP
jgi:hypothetical protein